jgi:hypothetical protein
MKEAIKAEHEENIHSLTQDQSLKSEDLRQCDLRCATHFSLHLAAFPPRTVLGQSNRDQRALVSHKTKILT